jgi:hypothetical protein
LEERGSNLAIKAATGAALADSRPGRAVINAMMQKMLVKEVTSPCVYGIGGPKRLLDDHPRLVMAITRSAIKRFGYDGVSSHIKEYANLPGYGYTDLLMGRTARHDVYPMLADWMASVAGS